MSKHLDVVDALERIIEGLRLNACAMSGLYMLGDTNSEHGKCLLASIRHTSRLISWLEDERRIYLETYPGNEDEVVPPELPTAVH